ncbi:MAG: hypothetical protein AB1Z23_02205 [Eubacteriales bacterium]
MESLLKERNKFYRLGGVAAFLQIALVIAGIIVIGILGIRPENAREALEAFKASPFAGLMQDELLTVFMIVMYFFTFTALFFALYETKPVTTFFSVLFTFVAVILTITTHSAFSLMHLSQLYAEASSEAAKLGIVSAAEAVIARNMWYTTAGYFCGIFMQGSGVAISIVMLKNKNFALITALGGIICNGVDLMQHLLHYSMPAFAEKLLYAAGPFYFIWFVFTGIDLIKLSKR